MPGSWSEVGEGLAYVCTRPLLAPFQGAQGSPALRTSKSITIFFQYSFLILSKSTG